MQAGVQCFNINTEIFDCSSFKGVDKFEQNLRMPNELFIHPYSIVGSSKIASIFVFLNWVTYSVQCIVKSHYFIWQHSTSLKKCLKTT